MFAIIKVYNDVQFIVAAVESIKRFVEGIIVGDGAYELYYEVYKKHFKHAKVTSTDGSIEVLKHLGDLPDIQFLRVPPKGWKNQVEKMNALLQAVPEDAWFLDLNADEMLVGDVAKGFREITESGCITGRVPLVNLGCDIDRLHYFWHPRIWKNIPGTHFEGTHWQIRDKYGRIIESDYPVWWTQDMVMCHFKPLKPRVRLQPHLEYMAVLRDRGWQEPHREEIDDYLGKGKGKDERQTTEKESS